MSAPTQATYESLPETSDNIQASTQRLIDTRAPGLVIRQAGGTSITDNLAFVPVSKAFHEAGFEHEPTAIITFDHLRPFQSDSFVNCRPTGIEWKTHGVTAFHGDRECTEPGSSYSFNRTASGTAELRLHRGQLENHDMFEQWEVLDRPTGDLLFEEVVDPDMMDPHGYKAVIHAGDIVVFDASLLHIVSTLEAPRHAEAFIFNRRVNIRAIHGS